MESKEKNETIHSRRELFKQAAKNVLPILGVAVLASIPIISKATQSSGCGEDSCRSSCKGGCSGSQCKGGCVGGCKGGCSGCEGSCSSECRSDCRRTCKGTSRGESLYQ